MVLLEELVFKKRIGRGATCTTVPNHVIFDPRACTQFILDHGITRILFTPSLLQLIMDTLEPAEVARRMRGLRTCWLCGEVGVVCGWHG